jgi:rSAM/selenodomain-associated transferase 2/rSAM/selenodomain-associated transferase 1
MSTPHKERLIVFTRYPKPGTTKTRLIPLLGADGAADLHRQMTEHTMQQVQRLLSVRQLIVEVRFDGGNENLMSAWLGETFSYRFQEPGDLGLRMRRCFEDAFVAGADRAVIIGTDIPDITNTTILKAFNSLKKAPMVLGPAKDGGYYLIGFSSNAFNGLAANLFADIQWGNEKVMAETIRMAMDMGLSVALTEELEDIDRPENLRVWDRMRQRRLNSDDLAKISIVVPALNEAENLRSTVAGIGRNHHIEIILADGGSTDGTVRIAESLGVKVVNSSPPKAKQMNEGAMRAAGDILLFLHADTRLPADFAFHVRKCLRRPGVVAGAFELGISADMPALRLIERLANWRSRRLNLPYGDQAIFVLSALFHRLGGFPEIPIMEDFEFVRQLRKKGDIAIIPVPVATSPRRWKNLGVLKTTLINQLAVAMFYAQVPPKTIARWYRRGKGLP